jgi:anti-sigma B factor antagonist
LHQNQLRKPNNMTFAQEIKGENLILHITGDLIGEDNGTQLVSAVNDAMTHKVLTCIIDISDLRYINSSGIGVLITILTKFRNKGGEVYLMNPSESVKKLLVITKLNAIFHVIKSADEITTKR